MPFSYFYREKENLIEVECFGTLSIGEIFQYFLDIRDDSTIRKNAIEIVHLEKITNFQVSSKQASEMPDRYRSAREEKVIRATILIGSSASNFGMARMIQTYFNLHMPDHLFEIVRHPNQVEEKIKEARSGNLREKH